MGVIDGNKNSKKEHNDSFEKYYNKDLDLDEGKWEKSHPKSDIIFVFLQGYIL